MQYLQNKCIETNMYGKKFLAAETTAKLLTANEGYFIEYLIEMLKSQKPIPSTKIRHDSSASYGEILLFVHEAKS